MRLHFDTPISPAEGSQLMAEMREMLAARHVVAKGFNAQE